MAFTIYRRLAYFEKLSTNANENVLDGGLREMAHLFHQGILASVVSETFLEI